MAKSFFEVFPTLSLNDELKKLLSETEITKVSANRNRTSIRISLFGKHLIPKDEITIFGLDFFKANYPTELQKRFKLTDEQMSLSAVDLIVLLTQKYGFRDDYDRFYDLFIKDVRDSKLGTYTLDRVSDLDKEDTQDDND